MKKNSFFAAAAVVTMALGYAGSAEAVVGKVNYTYTYGTAPSGYVMVQYPLGTGWYSTAPSVCYYITSYADYLNLATSAMSGNLTVYAYGTSESSCPASPTAGATYYGGTLNQLFVMRNN